MEHEYSSHIIVMLDRLAFAGKLKAIDDILETMDIRITHESILTIYARNLFPYRSRLTNYKSYISSVHEELTKRGLDGNFILSGLKR